MLPRHDCSGRHIPQRPQWLPRFTDQILSALQYLHENKVVHRDIKPDNILYDTDINGQPNFYIADFGLSVAGSATAIGQNRAGTPGFMPPEILLNDNGKPGPASDVWSFAITLGVICGFWCPNEMKATDAQWNAKVQALGGNPRPGAPSPAFNGHLTEVVIRIWFRRLYALVFEDGVLPPMLKRMVAPLPHRASIEECRRASFDSLTLRPARRTRQDPYMPGQVHIPAQGPNDMSIDVHRGFY